MKYLTLIYSDDFTKKEILAHGEKQKVISCSSAAHDRILGYDIPFIKLADFFPTPVSFSKRTREWMDKWIYYSDGQEYPFMKLFSTDITNFWWFIDIELYFLFIEIIKTISEISEIIKVESPEEIILLDNNIERISLIKLICRHKRINLRITDRKKKILLQNQKKNITKIVANLQRNYRYKWIRRWSNRKQKELDKNLNNKIVNKFDEQAIFFTHPSHWRNSKDPSKGGVKENYYFSMIFERLQELNIQPIDVHIVNRTRLSSRIIKEIEKSDRKIPLKILQSYYQSQPYKEKSIILSIQQKLNSFFINPLFQEKLLYNDIQLFPVVLSSILQLIKNNIPLILLTIENVKEMISKEKPRFIFLINEYSLYERAAIIAAKMKKVPCYAMQHGLISKEHPGYVIRSEKTSPVIIELPQRVDKTLLYGEGFSSILVSLGNYTSDQIQVVGNIIWDMINEINSSYDPQALKTSLNIPKNRKVILHTTENLPDGSNREISQQIIKIFLKMEESKYFLVIKVHPGENIRIYTSLVPKGCQDILVVKDIALGEILSISDVLVTVFSTTVFDAIISNVPAITVNFPHSIINSFFYDLDLSYKADRHTLSSVLTMVLEGEKIKDFIYPRNLIIEQYAAGLDSKAMDRILEALNLL